MKLKHFFTATLLSSCVFASAADLKDIDKDMRIMKRILEASIEESNRFTSRVEATYLAHQGMVFRVHSGRFLNVPAPNGDWETWGENIGLQTMEMVRRAIPAVAEVLPPEAVDEMNAEIERSIEDITDKSSPETKEIREKLDALRNELREQKELYRDRLRELRKIERERLRAEQKDQAQLEQQRQLLEEEMKKHEQRMQKYSETMEAYRLAKQKAYQEKKQNTVKELVTSLCEYNASLKSLNSDEYVTLIFDSFANQDGKENKVYVFKKSELADCESDDDGIKELLSSADIYYQ